MKKLTKTQQDVINLLSSGRSLVLFGKHWCIGENEEGWKTVSRHTIEALIAKNLIKPTSYGLR